MKTLGLDVGTNSVGWALIEDDKIIALGSRIVPMGAEMKEFEKGNAQTKNADRRINRGIRKSNKRYKQRRNKLLYVLKALNMLPEQFRLSKDFDDPKKLQKVSILPIAEDTDQLDALALYELRTKALTSKVGPHELGRLLYFFNQLRGYAGGDDEEADDKKEKEETEGEEQTLRKLEKVVETVKIVSDLVVIKPKQEDAPDGKKQRTEYEVTIRRQNDEELSGKTFLDKLKKGEDEELQLTIRRNKKGEITSVVIGLPAKTSWRKDMEEFDKQLEESGLHPGQFFYEQLKKNKRFKVRKRVILRQRLQAEFDDIWKEQVKHHPVLSTTDAAFVESIACFLFPGTNAQFKQEQYRKEAIEGGLYHIIRNQIIYYQRELKDQSHLIGKCQFEPEEKVIPKSHPLFQEFKLWEQINKLTINTKKEIEVKGKTKTVYDDKLTSAAFKAALYDELQDKREIGFSTVYKKLGLRDKVDFLNGLNVKGKLKGNDTRQFLKKALGAEVFQEMDLENPEKLKALWEILYYAKGNEYDPRSERTQKVYAFLQTNLPGDGMDLSRRAVEVSKLRFKKAYGSVSEKAIQKLLPLMRAGKYYSYEAIPADTEGKLKELHGDNLTASHQIAAKNDLESFPELLVEGGLMYFLASTIAYGQHTAKQIKAEDSLSHYKFISPIPQGELRNPIGEQMVNETLRLVREIWKQHGKPGQIKIELARELKNSAGERSKISSAIEKNRKANDRIRDRLLELKQDVSAANIERYKLWSSQEDDNGKAIWNDASKSEIEKMKLWEQQGLVSPYTGKPIPLSQLFDKGLYDIDHIIPKSRFFDDSLANKVICERSINDDKGNRTAWEYFDIGSTRKDILTQEQFIEHVNKFFFGRKRKNLLARQIPKDFVERQKKDTQYISIKIKEELAKIVGSANVKTTTGGITDYLRTHWGLTERFKAITKERFEKAKPVKAAGEFERYKKSFEERKKAAEKKGLPFTETLESQESFIKNYSDGYITYDRNRLKIKDWSKRFDHRHHALDALVVACTEQGHVQRLNNLNKVLQDWLRKNKDVVAKDFDGTDDELLETFLRLEKDKREAILNEIEGFRNFDAPWTGFAKDAEEHLRRIVVSIKPKQKLLIQKVEKGPNAGKEDMLRIRGALHEATIYGLRKGKETQRIELTKLAEEKFATEKAIEKIVDETLRDAIRYHLVTVYGKDKKSAFSAEGIKEFNANRVVPVYGIKIHYKSPLLKISLSKLKGKKADAKALIEQGLDANVKEILLRHLIQTHQGDQMAAFSKEGVKALNAGKDKAIKSFKIPPANSPDEEQEEALQRIDRKSSYNHKLYVKTGDNYAFAVLQKGEKRTSDIISFYDAAVLAKDGMKSGRHNVDEIVADYFRGKNPEAQFLFLLKQNELVYLPNADEVVPVNESDARYYEFWNDTAERAKRVYSVVKFSGRQIYFLKHDIAQVIENKAEFGTQNCYEKVDGVSIKDKCVKIQIDRLGKIVPFYQGGRRVSNGIASSLNEPEVTYGKLSIRTFSSFKEMNEADAKEMAAIPPEEHLRNATHVISQIHADELKRPMNKKLKFDS